MGTDKLDSSPKKKIAFSLPVSSQLILKFVYMLDILINQIVHTEYFDDTFPILQNFQKTILLKNVVQLHSGFLHSNTIL